MAEHWIRFGADGWRLDVAAEIDDDDFWREFRRRVKAIDPEAYIVAEIWHEDHRWLQGDQFDAYMNYPLAEAILSFCGGSHLDRGSSGSTGSSARTSDPRTARRSRGGSPASSRTYDPAITAGSSTCSAATTRRGCSRCAAATRFVRLATLVQMTVGGAPCIYYGDEIGMAGEQDPFCRASYPVDPTAGDTELRAFTAALTALRHANPALRRGELAVIGAAGMSAAYRRSDDDATFVVCLNAGADAARLGVDLPGLDGRTLVEVELPGAHAGAPLHPADGRAEIEIPARRGRILRLEA